ncbi:MAG: TlpA family protein disulfide reductase [Helicobacteraceae bacterium]|nr:TlpA family protein disulfide reductase [Helicobacteraceae bacterium]
MTKQIIVLIFISLFIAGCDRNSQKEITIQKEKYSLISLDSDKILFDKTTNLLSQNHNKPYLLVFLSTWCDYCLGQAQHIANMHEEFGDKINIYGVFLDRDEKEDELKKFVRQSNTKFKWFYKGDIAMLIDTYQIKTLPFILLFDKNGNLVMSYNGITPEEMITFNIKKLL